MFDIESARALLADHHFLIAMAAAGGLCVGSFLNVVIYRLPLIIEAAYAEDHPYETTYRRIAQARQTQQTHQAEQKPKARLTLASPGSHCPTCKRPVRPRENIPVLSYLLLGGRCAGCGTPIPIRYPLIELGSGILSAVSAWHFGPTLQLAGALLLLWTLTALIFIDIDHRLLPDCITLPLLWLGLLLNSAAVFVPLYDAVWGAVTGYMVLWSVYWLYRIYTGKDGMGYGDFKLLAALGAWLGWSGLLPMLILASLGAAMGGVWKTFMAERAHTRAKAEAKAKVKAYVDAIERPRAGYGVTLSHVYDDIEDDTSDQTIAFGPYLAIAGAAALFYETARWVAP
ncbi:prepilin peptidase [Herbaspirillum sp.]|uniref:prepilin peptidase n=1 Tax=Herbaspirillum sp. TaxID=1890675 RepID=UPI0031E37870